MSIDTNNDENMPYYAQIQSLTTICSLDFWLCCSLMFLVQLGCAILGAPSPKLLEMSVCREYLKNHEPDSIPSDGNIPESTCKTDVIQGQFVFLLTAISALTNLVALIMQMPMGWLADKKGRRMTLTLNIISTILYWDWVLFVGYAHDFVSPSWLYLAPAFLFVGGGPWASAALIFAAIHDGVTPQQRTTAFSVMEAAAGIADLLGPIITAATMTWRLWIPFSLATACFLLMFIPTFLIADYPRRDTPDVLCETEEVVASEETTLLSIPEFPPRRASLRSRISIWATCTGSFLLLYTSRDSINFIIPWASSRFKQSMARVGLLFSLRAIISFFLFLALLPGLDMFLSRSLGMGTCRRAFVLSLGSVLLLSTGSLLVAFGPTLWVLILGFAVTVLGSGASITLRSLVATSIDNASSGRLYSAIATVGTLGGLLGMPLMGAAYEWGISHHISSIAPPFFVAAILYALIVVVLLCFKTSL